MRALKHLDSTVRRDLSTEPGRKDQQPHVAIGIPVRLAHAFSGGVHLHAAVERRG